MIEAEIKARLSDPDAVRRRLDERTAGVREVYSDIYFDTSDRSLTAGDRELRVRTITGPDGARHLLTYKGQAADAETGSKPEAETDVADPEAAREILEGLGYGADLAFTKECTNYRLISHGREFLATVVTVPEIDGTFIEVETQSPEEEMGAALDAVRSLLADLGVKRDEWSTEAYTDAVRAGRHGTAA